MNPHRGDLGPAAPDHPAPDTDRIAERAARDVSRLLDRGGIARLVELARRVSGSPDGRGGLSPEL